MADVKSYTVVQRRTETTSGGIGAQASLDIPPARVEGARRFITQLSAHISSQVAVAAGELVLNLREGKTGTGSPRMTIRVELSAAVVAPYDYNPGAIEYEIASDTDSTLEQGAAYASLNVDLTLTVEDRVYY